MSSVGSGFSRTSASAGSVAARRPRNRDNAGCGLRGRGVGLDAAQQKGADAPASRWRHLRGGPAIQAGDRPAQDAAGLRLELHRHAHRSTSRIRIWASASGVTRTGRVTGNGEWQTKIAATQPRVSGRSAPSGPLDRLAPGVAARGPATSSMSAETAREFVDANVLVYAFDPSAGSKQAAAGRLLERLWNAGTGCLSVQVLIETRLTRDARIARSCCFDPSGAA